jgi:Ca2+/H+ antiporter
VFVARTIPVDGESNWLEGFLLVTVYAILGMGFFYLRTPSGCILAEP